LSSNPSLGDLLLELHREIASIRRGNLLLMQGICGLLLRERFLSRRQVTAELAKLVEPLYDRLDGRADDAAEELPESDCGKSGIARPDLRVIKGGKIH